MARVALTVHDLPRETYDALDVREEISKGVVWKRVNSPSIEVTYFRNEAEDSDDA